MSIEALLNDPAKQKYHVTCLTARLFRILLTELNITPTRYHHYVTGWLNDPSNNVSTEATVRSTERGNLVKEINRDTMTIKTLTKMLKVFNTRKAFLSVTLSHPDGTVTRHAVKYDIHYQDVDETTHITTLLGNIDHYLHNTPRNVLSKLLLQVWSDLGITTKEIFDAKCKAWLALHAELGASKNRLSSLKGNLIKGVTKSTISSDMFLESMLFLGVNSMVLQLTTYHGSSRRPVESILNVDVTKGVSHEQVDTTDGPPWA